MNFFKKLWLVFTYGDEIDGVLVEARRNLREAARRAKVENLNLCLKHQPANVGSHYSEHNCDHCKALKRERIGI